MTDDELKALVASIAEGQKKTDVQLAKNAAQFDRMDALQAENAAEIKLMTAEITRTDERLKHTDEQIKLNAAQQKLTTEQIKLNGAQQKLTDIQVKETCKIVAEVSRKVDKVAKLYGGMSNNQGAATEEFYYNTLKANPVLQGMRFDKIYKNIVARGSDIEDEYDILLVNGKAIYIIEVKYKVHPTDIEKLLRKKAKNFTMLFTDYSGYEKHLGIACFQIDDEIKKWH